MTQAIGIKGSAKHEAGAEVSLLIYHQYKKRKIVMNRNENDQAFELSVEASTEKGREDLICSIQMPKD